MKYPSQEYKEKAEKKLLSAEVAQKDNYPTEANLYAQQAQVYALLYVGTAIYESTP